MTSIEWLIKELYTEMNMSGDGRVLNEILDEAKEIHKAEQENKFTEEQVAEAIEMAREYREYPFEKEYEYSTNEILQSLKQPKKD